MTFRNTFAAGVFAALLWVSPTAVLAQDTVRIVPLDTVTVQVLGTPGPALRAPFPVSVVQEAEIRRGRPALELTDALSELPGVQEDNSFNYALGERISVRGLGDQEQFRVREERVH